MTKPSGQTQRLLSLLAGSLIVLFLALYVIIIKVIVPTELPARLVRATSEACPQCHLQIRKLETSLLHPGDLHFGDVALKAGDPRTTAVQAHVQNLEISMSLTALVHRELLIYTLHLQNPFIELIDGEHHSPPTHSSAEVKMPFVFEIQNTSVSDGVFRYVRTNHKLGTSRLEFSEIDARSDRFSNRPEFLRSLTHSTLTGTNTSIRPNEGDSTIQPQNQQPRKFQTLTLDLKVNYLVQPTQAEVELTATRKSLKPMGEFLAKNDGIQLTGKIENGTAKVKVEGRSIWAELSSRYSDLKVAIEPTADRSKFSASLMNLGAELAVREKSRSSRPTQVADSAQSDRHASGPNVSGAAIQPNEAAVKPELEIKRIFTEREEFETVAHAIIRALKEVSVKSAANTL